MPTPYILTYTQLNQLCELTISNCPAHLFEIKACLELMLFTGCRAEESFNKSRWLKDGNNFYILTASKESNTRYFNTIDLPENWKLVFNDGTRLTDYVNYRKIQYYLASQLAQYNIARGQKTCHSHLYRHTFVQAIKFFGGTLEQAQTAIGHKTISSTAIYYNAVITSLMLPP